jgi:sulfoxide reductase heme-binding subunit YedZ
MQFARRPIVAEEDDAVRSTAETVHLIAATVGFLSLFLLWLAVVWGMVLRNGWAQTRIKHATVYGGHQVLALLGLTLGLVHGFVQLADPTGTVYLVHLVVPFAHPYDPIGLGVGVISLELFVALTLSILIQRRLGYTRWRALHAFSYVAFMLLVAHVLISGTDTYPSWVWSSVIGAWGVTVLLWLGSTGLLAGTRRRVGRVVGERHRGQELTVNVDASRCARFGFCEQEAPDVFRLRSDGRLSYRGSISLNQVEAVMKAVEVCPARAIGLNQVPTKVFTPRPSLEALADDALRGATTGTGNTGRHRIVRLGDQRDRVGDQRDRVGDQRDRRDARRDRRDARRERGKR